MKLPVILLALFFLAQACDSQEVKKINAGSSDTSMNKPRRNLMVSVTGDNTIFIGTKPIVPSQLDSMLGIEISKLRQGLTDTVTVVINADTSASYGRVYDILRSAKKLGAKVVATVK